MKKWEDLTKKDQEVWNNLGKNHDAWMMIQFKCALCSTKFDKSWIIIKNREKTWNNKFLVHMQTSHGIPPDAMQDYVKYQRAR